MNEINIVLICDDSYIIPTLTTISSIKDSKKNETLCNVYIIANSTKSDLYKIFECLVSDNFNIKVIIVNEQIVNDLAGTMKDTYCVATPSALMKFFIPNLISEIEKILYLDGDIIVKADLYELYNIDINNVYGAVVVDSTKLYSEREIVKNSQNYFNSGMMLLNLYKMKDIISQLIEVKSRQKNQILMDQDVFNNVIGKNIKTISIRYNFLYTNLNRARNNFCMADLNYLYGTSYTRLRDIYEDAVVVHFSSKDKPWKCINSPMARIWYNAYRKMKNTVSEIKQNITQIEEFEKTICKDTALINALSNLEIDFSCKLIISLTSFPKRIEYLYQTLESLLEQSEIADQIILWLSQEEFPNKENDLPATLIKLTNEGIQIRWCENLKSHKKYFYTMLQNPTDIIITVDDDIIYEDGTIQYLFKSFLKYPTCISANRVHAIGFCHERKIEKYMEWPHELENVYQIPNLCIFPTGVGGILYPPNSLNQSAFDLRKLDELCPSTDDIWLKLMAVLNETKTVCAYPNIELNLIRETQSDALYKINRVGGENDRQLNAAIEYCLSIDSNIINKLYNEYKILLKSISVPAISVIIPINNSVCNIENIQSILNQSLKNVEYIILDNGSKGNVGRKLVNDDRVIYISNKNWTIGKEINYALDRVRGEYIIIADSNSKYDYHFLKKNYVNARNGNADVSIFKIDYFDHTNLKARFSEWEKKYHRIPPELFFDFSSFKSDTFNTFSYRVTDKMYKREFLREKTLTFDEIGNGYGDFCFIFGSLIGANRITYQSELLAFQDYHSKGTHASIHKWEFIFASLKKLKNFLADKLVWTKELQRDYDNFALGVMMHEYNYVDISDIEWRYNALKKYEFYEILSLEKNSEYYYDQYLYNQLNYIMHTDYLWTVAKNCIGAANFCVEQSREIRENVDKMHQIQECLNHLNHRVKEMEYIEYCLNETRKSKSYKLGLFLTAIPRKIRGNCNELFRKI